HPPCVRLSDGAADRIHAAGGRATAAVYREPIYGEALGVRWNRKQKDQAPTSKHQGSSKLQAPNEESNVACRGQRPISGLCVWCDAAEVRFGVWSLGFLWMLELGIWSFSFRTSDVIEESFKFIEALFQIRKLRFLLFKFLIQPLNRRQRHSLGVHGGDVLVVS